MLKELIKIANELDSRGLAEEADVVDGIVNNFTKIASKGELIDLDSHRTKKPTIDGAYLVVLDDRETYSDGAFIVGVTEPELNEIWAGEKAYEVVEDQERWIDIWDLIKDKDLK
jgi:hypothetical protein